MDNVYECQRKSPEFNIQFAAVSNNLERNIHNYFLVHLLLKVTDKLYHSSLNIISND